MEIVPCIANTCDQSSLAEICSNGALKENWVELLVDSFPKLIANTIPFLSSQTRQSSQEEKEPRDATREAEMKHAKVAYQFVEAKIGTEVRICCTFSSISHSLSFTQVSVRRAQRCKSLSIYSLTIN